MLENKFIDIKQQEVQVGDFIMYPIYTFIRCGVVKRIYSSKRLSAVYQWGRRIATDEDLLKAQEVSTYQRSVIKISEQELHLILNRPKTFDALIRERENILRIAAGKHVICTDMLVDVVAKYEQ